MRKILTLAAVSSLRRLALSAVQSVVGDFCVVAGALLLVAPAGPESFSQPLQPHAAWWGFGFLLAGFALLGVAALANQADLADRRRAGEQSAELLAGEQAARAEAEALAALTASVAGSLDPTETLAAAVNALPRLFGAHVCGIALPEDDGCLAYAAINRGDTALLRQFRWEPGIGYVGRAFAEGRLVRSDDLSVDPNAHRPDLIDQLRTRAFLAAPLLAHGRTLGVITVASPRANAFSRHHEELLVTIAQHVATALASGQARDAARHEAAQKAAILEQLADAVLVFDLEACIVLANRAAGALFGLPSERLLGLSPERQPWRILDHAGRPIPPAARPLNRALEGETAAREFRVVTADGAERWAWASAAPLCDEAGQISGAVAVLRDITLERKRQQRATESEKLRALGQMASGVAHDLNQYLALVAGHANLALEALSEGHQPHSALRDSLGTILQAASDGAETVKRLVTFAQPHQEGAPESLDLGTLLREVAQLTAPRWRDSSQAQGRPISLLVESSGDTSILGWSASLREALTNLIFNAVDALPNGGTIRLAARCRGDRVEAEVADSGIGMSPEVQTRVFEPFFSTKGEHGSGLGLAIVFGIIERHEGQIAIDSAPGRGTTFRLSFPAGATAAPARPSSFPEAKPTPLRILVVDDEVKLAQMAALMLAPDGHEVVTAASGEEALEHLSAGPFDLVISDLGMGAGMNGWELSAQVRERWPAARFILATGWGTTIDGTEAAARGVEAVLAKPYSLSDLRQLAVSASPRAA